MGSRTLVVRADATVVIGTGHVMRCLALAQAWQDAGGSCVFAMAEPTPAVEERVVAEGIQVVRFRKTIPDSSQDAAQLVELARARGATWLVVDGYHFDAEYQRRLKDTELKLLWVDDNGESAHYYADLVLNQNAHAGDGLYVRREPYTRLLLGPRYALLRREFARWRDWKPEIARFGRKVLITMGGSDPDNVTSRVIEALGMVRVEGLEATVVVGGSNPHFESLQRLAARCGGSIRLLRNASTMPELLAWADVAVSAAGTTCWEMCLLGLPAILIDLAPNQRPIAEELDRRGVGIHLGNTHEVSAEKIASELEGLLRSQETRAAISQRAREVIDGKGVIRVVSAIQSGGLRLRRAEAKDCRLLWEWVNDPDVRAASFSTEQIPWKKHQSWFLRKMEDPDCYIFIGENDEGTPVGQIRVDQRSSEEGEIDVSLSREFRGCGYGGLLVALGAQRAFAETAWLRLHAFVKAENEASWRAFERAGYKRTGEEQVCGCRAIDYVRTREQDQT